MSLIPLVQISQATSAHERSRLCRCQCVRESGPHRIGTVLVNKWAISVSDKRNLIQDWRSGNPSRIGRVVRKTRRGTGRPAAHAPRAAVSPTQRSTARAGPGPPAGRCEVSGRSASGANRWRLWCDRWPEPCRPQSGLPPTTPQVSPIFSDTEDCGVSAKGPKTMGAGRWRAPSPEHQGNGTGSLMRSPMTHVGDTRRG